MLAAVPDFIRHLLLVTALAAAAAEEPEEEQEEEQQQEGAEDRPHDHANPVGRWKTNQVNHWPTWLRKRPPVLAGYAHLIYMLNALAFRRHLWQVSWVNI